MTIKATRKSWFDTDAQATTSATSSTWYASAPTDHYSTSQAAVQLTRSGLSWNGYQVYNKPVALTFSFLDSTTTASPRGDKGIVAFNSAQQAAAMQSLQAWSDLANIKFTQVASGGRLTFANYTQFSNGQPANDQAYAYLPSTSKAGGSMWFDYNISNIRSPDKYEYGRQTITHELGHALGLSHPGDYNSGTGVISYSASATYVEDSRQYSLMSYWSETNTGAKFNGHYAVAPLLHDIAAIQRLYGANMTTRTGNTVYGFDSNSGRDYYSASSSSDVLIFSVWDAGGNDTLNFSRYGQNQLINLNAQTFSNVGGLIGNVSIALGAVIENAIAGAGNDSVIGNAVANLLRGNAGSDRLYGNDGNDALYGDDGNDLLYGGNGDDMLTGGNGIDTLNGDGGNDRIWGSEGDDLLYGGSGNDTLNGENGNDRLWGGEGIDILYGGNGNDTLYGENGNDRLYGGENDDLLYGGNGNDTLYGENGNDRLYGGENDDLLYGGNGNDTLYGENGNDRLWGGEGADALYGGSGNDILYGENGNDRLEGGAGIDRLYGGGGADKLYGGDGNDLFIFTRASDSLPALRDLIGDFASGRDKIDLSALDSAAHPLHFTSKFTGKLGEMQMLWDVNTHLTHLSLNLTGDSRPDMTIDIAAHPNTRIDFIV
ncbi:M10 family metallopeptidase C-terminal domain-containing protein [Mixta calida]|nr:M10 family metallopeptidase C-terminal domain-containing protein [Mixta calida]